MRFPSHYWLLLGAVLWPMSCQLSATPPGLAAYELTSPRARLSFAEIPPRLGRPTDAPGADKLPPELAGTVRRAEDYLAKGRYGKAVPLLERAAAKLPDSPRIQRALGFCYHELGDAHKARSLLMSSAAKAPDHVRLQMLLGQYAIRDGRAEAALRHFRLALLCSDAVDSNPDTAEAALRLAALLEQQGYLAAAAECYERLERLVSLHGDAYAKRGLLRSLVLQPERCMLAAGRLWLRLGQSRRAAKLLVRAYRRDKTHRQAGRLAVEALVAEGDYAQAEAIVGEMALERALGSQAVSAALALCRARRDPAVPLRLLQAFLDSRGSNAAFVSTMALVAADYGAADRAVELLERYAAAADRAVELSLTLARLYLRAGRTAQALEKYAALLKGGEVGPGWLRMELTDQAGRYLKPATIDAAAAAARRAKGTDRAAMLCVAGVLAEVLGHRERAEKFLAEAVKADRKFFPAYEVRHELAWSKGELDRAGGILAELKRVAGDHYFRFYLEGKDLLARGEAAKAVEAFQEVRKRRSGHVPTLLRESRALMTLGRFREAERRLLEAFVLRPARPDVALDLFSLYVAARRLEDAGTVAKRFAQRNPLHPAGGLMQARHRVLTHRSDEALALLEEVLADRPEEVEVRVYKTQLELIYPLDGPPIPTELAKPALKELAELYRRDPLRRRAGRVYADLLANQKRFAEAAAVRKAMLERDPTDAALAGAYLEALLKAGRKDEAAAELERLAGRRTLTRAMERVVVDKLLELELHDKAEALVEGWLKDAKADEDRRTARRLLALQVYEAAKHFDKAQNLLDGWLAALKRPELATPLRREKVRMFVLAGQYDQAIAYVRKWARQWPEEAQAARSALTGALLEAKAYARALPVVDEFIKAGGDEEFLRHLRVVKLMCLAELNRYGELMGFARKWIAREPESAEPGQLVVSVLFEHKQYDRALELIDERLDRLARSDRTSKDWAENVHKARALAIQILLEAGRGEEALRRAEAYARAEPKNLQAQKLYVSVLGQLERHRQYLAQLERIYRLAPDDAGVNNDLGYSWADEGIKLAQAEAMVRKALKDRPDEVALQDSLGWVLYKRGRFKEAKKVFDKVVDAKEDELHPIILAHAGDTCWRLGLKLEAMRLWARAVVLAEKQEKKDRETRAVLKLAPQKILAGRRGARPRLAPLGKGVRVAGW